MRGCASSDFEDRFGAHCGNSVQGQGMRAVDGMRIGVDRTGGGADCGRNSISASRDPDCGGGRLAASFDTRSTTGFGHSLGGLAPGQSPKRTVDSTMPSTHTPRRIACLQPSATVILDAIGELGRVVACTRYCAEVVPGVADGSRAILADSWTADTAQIVAAKPDLVIAAVPYQEKAVSDILRAGVRFLGLAPKTLADIYTDIATISG